MRYEQLTKQYLIPALGRIKLTKLRPLHVENAYAKLTRTDKNGKEIAATANTRKAAGTALSIALRHAVRLRLITSNPAADISKPRPAFREMAFMTPNQARQFLEVAKSSRNYALYALDLGTGCRQGELLGLSWADIDYDKSMIEVRRSLSQVKKEFILKEPKSRTISAPTFVLSALREHRAAALKAGLITAPVFCTKNGTHLQKSNVPRDFMALVKTANEVARMKAERSNTEPDLIPPLSGSMTFATVTPAALSRRVIPSRLCPVGLAIQTSRSRSRSTRTSCPTRIRSSPTVPARSLDEIGCS